MHRKLCPRRGSITSALGVELTAEEKQAAALLETDADAALAQSRLGSSNDTTVDSTRKVAEELAGNEGNK